MVTNEQADDEARPATIYDVAKAAGVSPSTVSRALSRPGRVSDATASKVHAVASELGYRRSHVFRPAMQDRTGLIGLLVTDLANPFTFGIVRGAERTAAERGYSVVLMESLESVATERDLVTKTLPTLDGLIVANSRASDTAIRGYAKQVPTTVLNRVVGGVPSAVPDNADGMHQAVDHLVSLGHRRIAYLGGPDNSWANGVRWRAFREACGERGVTDLRLGPVDATARGGVGSLPQVLDARVTAIVCFNDMVAVGLMRALTARGIRIPSDLSIVGIDNTFVSDIVTPGLTTVACPQAQLGERATLDVTTMIKEGSQAASTEPVTLPMKLVVRHSTARLPGAK